MHKHYRSTIDEFLCSSLSIAPRHSSTNTHNSSCTSRIHGNTPLIPNNSAWDHYICTGIHFVVCLCQMSPLAIKRRSIVVAFKCFSKWHCYYHTFCIDTWLHICRLFLRFNFWFGFFSSHVHLASYRSNEFTVPYAEQHKHQLWGPTVVLYLPGSSQRWPLRHPLRLLPIPEICSSSALSSLSKSVCWVSFQLSSFRIGSVLLIEEYNTQMFRVQKLKSFQLMWIFSSLRAYVVLPICIYCTFYRNPQWSAYVWWNIARCYPVILVVLCYNRTAIREFARLTVESPDTKIGLVLMDACSTLRDLHIYTWREWVYIFNQLTLSLLSKPWAPVYWSKNR